MSMSVNGCASDTKAISKIATNAHNYKSTTEGAVTLTAAEFVNGTYIQGGTPGAVSKTTPTAALIAAAYPEAQVGTKFVFDLHNGGDGVLTLVGGTGVTLLGTATCAAAKNKRFVGVFTAVDTPAVTVICGAQLA